MICTAVPREAVNIVWGDVCNMLAQAVNTSGGKYHIDDIYNHLTKGIYSLWIIIDNKDKDKGKVVAAITTRLIEYPNKKALAMDWIGGSKINQWLPIAVERLSDFASDCGCSHLEGYGRKAWSRLLKKYNWKPEYIAYKMEIKNG